MNVHYVLEEDALTGALVHFLAEVCPWSLPFRTTALQEQSRREGTSKRRERVDGAST